MHQPNIIVQSTTEPILFGGYQDPNSHCRDGVLYVRFNSRRDCHETFGLEDINSVYKLFDEGKTRSNVRPMMAKLDCGAILLISGCLDVYLASWDDPTGEEWNDMVQVVEVPKEDYYKSYFGYTGCNCFVAPCNEDTYFITYSDFQWNAPDGNRAKSMLVSKVTVE